MNRQIRTGGLLFIFILLTALSALPVSLAEDKYVELNLKADHAWKTGDFAASARFWERLEGLYESSGLNIEQARALMKLSEACLALGNVRKAKDCLDRAEKILDSEPDTELMIHILACRGMVQYQSGSYRQAESFFKKSLALCDDEENSSQAASIRLNFGNLLFDRGLYDKALEQYVLSHDLAQKPAGTGPLAVKTAINLSRTNFALKNEAAAVQLLNQASAGAKALEDSHEKAFCLISIAQTAAVRSMPDLAWDSLASAVKTAERIKDTRSYSLALGELGSLYADRGRTSDSVSSYLRAVFAAHEAGADDLLYRWQWGLGRQYNAQKDRDNAFYYYDQAVKTVSRIREDLAIECRKKYQDSFRESVGLLYFELADFLLKRSREQHDAAVKQADLVAAQNTIEQMKKMELQDYFRDDCVIALEKRQSALDESIPATAVIYPVLLPDRLELIVTFPDTVNSYPVAVGQEELTAHVRNLRKKLQYPGSRFLRYSQKLYNWLIRPFESDLEAHKITTLVFVPDGPLRTIPMAALHDGECFLVEKLALATTPGLIVTDLVPFRNREAKILLGGITQPVQGFSSLPGVDHELKGISKIMDSQLLMDEDFDPKALQETLQLSPYSIVHIASHGQFDNDPANTFLLTHNDRLTLDRLEYLMGISNFRQEPVALLTLSACQTAVGDDRAALGLAGVAVKSGARSALASLWFINDTATSMMVVDFYRHLSYDTSKANALQQAQKAMIRSADYHHPAYWAPFLLIGNWL